jgi:ATP-dependent DNA ligase
MACSPATSAPTASSIPAPPAAKPPAKPGWVHEIKHDGYRLVIRRDGSTVGLFTRNGYDCAER